MSVRFIPAWANPDYPHGRVLRADVPSGTPCCKFDLQYPAPGCGHFNVDCEECGIGLIVPVAGRADDYASVILPCKIGGTGPPCVAEFRRRQREHRENRHDQGDEP